MIMFLCTVTTVLSRVMIASADQSGLLMSVFNNTAFTGKVVKTTILEKSSKTNAFDFSIPRTEPISIEAVGTLAAIDGVEYSFKCDFGDAAFAMLRVDDHLVCQQGANNGSDCQQGPCDTIDNPLPTMSKNALPIKLVVVINPAYSNSSEASLPVHIAVTPTPVTSPVEITTTLPALEVQRREMQLGLTQGWGAYYDMSYLDHVLLPHGARINLILCQIGIAGMCLTEARIDWPHKGGLQAEIRLGLHAYDRSYNQLFIDVNGCNVSITASGGNDLNLLVETVAASSPSDKNHCDGYALIVAAETTWFRANTLSSKPSQLTFESYGLGSVTVQSTRATDTNVVINPDVGNLTHLAYTLTPGFQLGLTSSGVGTTPSVSQINATLMAKRDIEIARYSKYGDLAETKSIVQIAMMWQTIWNPLEQGPLAPVIRGNPWGLDKDITNHDWAYVMFDWDNHFGAYMLSLDAKELGYSAIIQVIKAKTAQGFVSNVATSTNKQRHSQPPVGSKILHEMFLKYNETWIVELLFDDLFDWNNWFVATRTLSPLNITCLGSIEGDMQDARFESGLDNSPMYDVPKCTAANGTCGPWNCTNGKCGNFANEKMQLYDTGMAAMHTMDCKSLMELAIVIGRTKEAAILKQRFDNMQTLIEDNLWDEETEIYVNRAPNGNFYPRISPTNFYPLQTSGPSDSRVDTMMNKWMLNSSHFCISPKGDFAGNSDACYWGLPSIQASDAAFPALGYWRGYVWGPMAQLTYWGLQNYDHVESARTVRTSLVKQMNEMMLNQWRSNGYICENYYPAKSHNGCSPGAMKMYHWGALTGFLSLVENGFY